MSGVKKRFITEVSPAQSKLLFLIQYDASSTASLLAKKTKQARTSLLYHLDLLEYSGYIKALRDGRHKFFMLTPKGEQFVRTGGHQLFKPLPDSSGPTALSDEALDRCHSVYIKSAIVRMPLEADLLKLGFQKGNKMKNWGQHFYGVRLQHCSVQITPNNFLFFLDEIFAESAHVATLLAFDLVTQAMSTLMEQLPGLTLGEPERLAVMVRQHHALQEDFLAKRVREDGFTVKTDRFEIDSSKGKPEIDFVDPQLAPEDFERYVQAKREAGPEGAIELVEETITGRFSPRRVRDELSRLVDLQDQTVKILDRLVPAGNPPATLPTDPGGYA